MLRLTMLTMLAVTAAEAQSAMEAQRRVWVCNDQAAERGLSGRARDEYVQRCVDGPAARPGRSGPQGDGGAKPGATGAAPAASSAWRLQAVSQAQLILSVVSTDRAFSLGFSCMIRTRLPSETFLSMPPGWGFEDEVITISLDGAPRRVIVGHSEGGVSLSDPSRGEAPTMSLQTLRSIASGQELRIPGMNNRGRSRSATFRVAGGEALLSEFERRCRG